MNAGTAAAILVGFFGLISGLGAAWLSYRAQKNTARADEVAAAFAAYDDLLSNHRQEIDRLRADLKAARDDGTTAAAAHLERVARATADLEASEQRARASRAELAEVLADLAALRAIVVDEVARSAAGQAIAQHLPGPANLSDSESEELEAIRHFLKRLPPENGDDHA